MVTKQKHFVYVLLCNDNTYYAGYAIDVARRLREHNGEGKAAGARYTRPRRPVQLIYQKGFKTRSEAQKAEAAFKKLTRPEKEIFLKRNTQPPLTQRKNQLYNLGNTSALGPRR